MSRFELISYPDAEALAQAAAREWVRDLDVGTRSRSAPAHSGEGGDRAERYCVALSGGRIARRFFAAVAALGRHPFPRVSYSLLLNRVHFFWGDERCVPAQDPESNFGLAQQLLLQPLGIPEAQIHRIAGEAPPAVAAAHAQAELCRLAPLSADGQPVLDLVFLGMGEDGHVASLFPGECSELIANPAVFRPVIAAKPPAHRVSLGYPAIVAARQVWVLASGSGKQEALRQSLAPDGQTPLARVLQLRSRTRILTDIAL
ncbi:MAG TPA: 6-phosphogluconolactonase [Candidatus Sulfotelmatobacter sp.]|nr:6-phosphogluconolactonase [Candidatus Sulfotelmatobacter sp.]